MHIVRQKRRKGWSSACPPPTTTHRRLGFRSTTGRERNLNSGDEALRCLCSACLTSQVKQHATPRFPVTVPLLLLRSSHEQTNPSCQLLAPKKTQKKERDETVLLLAARASQLPTAPVFSVAPRLANHPSSVAKALWAGAQKINKGAKQKNSNQNRAVQTPPGARDGPSCYLLFAYF